LELLHSVAASEYRSGEVRSARTMLMTAVRKLPDDCEIGAAKADAPIRFSMMGRRGQVNGLARDIRALLERMD